MFSFVVKLLFFIYFSITFSNASHIRFGTFKWQPTTQYNEIQFTLDLGFRTSAWFSNLPKNNDSINISFNFGDNVASTYQLILTTVDSKDDWFTGTSVFSHTYPTLEVGKTANYTAFYSLCCRISTLLNQKDGDFTIKSLVQIDNSNSLDKINWSPVSGMVPIYPVTYGRNNNFNIPASDQNLKSGEYSSLVFTFGEAKPDGMTLDKNTGMVYFMPSSVGLYCAKVIITDKNGAYITLDFILQSEIQNGYCHHQCNNSGEVCKKNSDCINCGNLVYNKTQDVCLSTKPIFIYPPTPKPKQTQTFVIGEQNEGFNVSCTTDAIGLNTTIQPVGFPIGFITKILEIGPNSTINLSWFPASFQDYGTYHKYIVCTDSLIKITTSIEIIIKKPDCSNGGFRDEGICVCQKNFTSQSDCLDCSKGYYGEKCIAVPPCVNGVSNSGILGDGKCYCNNGWIGDDCTISNSQSCGSLKSGVVSSSIMEQSYINPVGIQVYLANNQKYQIPVNIKIPEKNKLIDVYFLIDINQKDQNEFDNILSQLDGAKTKILELSPEGVSFGLGIIDENGLFADLAKIPSDSIVTSLENIKWSGYNNSITGKSLSAATKAAKTPLGWRTNAFKSMIIIPRTDLPLSPIQTEIDEFKNAFIEKSIAPVVIGIDVSLSNWNSTLYQCGFGAYKLSPEAGGWKNFVKSAFKETSSSVLGNGVLQNIIFKVNDNSGGLAFLKSIPENLPIDSDIEVVKTLSGLSLSLPINYNSSINPSLRVCTIGYGCIDVKTNYNHPPTPNPFGISCNQNSASIFQLEGSDPDRNILTFKFTSFLSDAEGLIKTSKGIDVSTQKDELYAGSENFTFSPYKNYLKSLYISFIADDGCLTSDSSAKVSFSINKVNQPPECSSTIVISEFGKTVDFLFTATDFEDDDQLLILNAQFIVSSELVSLEQYGQLTYNGTKVTIDTIIKKNMKIFFNQTKNPPNLLVPLTFKSKDSSGLFSNLCTHTINITHTNEAPISNDGTSVTIPRSIGNPLSLLSTDIDSKSAIFTIKKVISGKTGTFYSCTDNSCSCVAGSNGRIDITENTKYSQIQYAKNQASLPICFTNSEPSAFPNYAFISFTSTDDEGLESNLATVIVNIVGYRTNVAPIVTKIQDYSVYQDYLDSDVNIVTGTDADIDDYNPQNANNLIAIITNPPSNGILVTVQNGSSIAIQGNAPFAHYYRPNTGYAGIDSYSYQVIDTFKEKSSIESTTITIKPINHKPNVLIDVYKFTSESGGGVIETLNTSDHDGDNVICSVISLPKQISMYDDKGVQIKSVPMVLPNNAYSFKLLDPSIITPTPFSNVLSTFSINCVDDSEKTTPKGVLSTGDVIGNVQYYYINTPPKSNISSVKLSQDSFIAFSFEGSDTESNEKLLKVMLYSLPINGKLSKTIDSNVVLTKELIGGDNTFGLDELTYTPLPGQSNWDTVDHLGPLDKISYSIVDPQGLLSPSSTMSFQVRSRNPPIYLGDSEINVLQNTRFPLTIEGELGGGGLSVSIRILSFSGRGNLSISHSMGIEGFFDKLITEYPSQQLGSTSYNYAYNPPRNQFGSNFDQIQFILFDNDIISKIYNITVNVIHVNQPPATELISYRILNQFEKEIQIDGSTINMNVNDSVLIKIYGSDIDNQTVPLVALVSNPPLRGLIYSFDANSSDYLGREINHTSQFIPLNEDGYWYVIFIPTKGTTGDNYARVPFNVIDEKGVVSQTSTVIINVNSVNLQPKIYIGSNSNTFVGKVNLTISITNIALDDPDSVNNNISLIVSIVDDNDGDEVLPLSIIKLSFPQATPKCKPNLNLALITCIGSKKSLNASISTISIIGSISGKYRLKLFIDDLGYSAPSTVRAESHLNSTGYVNIIINDPIATTQNTNNKTVLSGAIAGASAGAALLVIGLWKMIKRSSPPTDTFFDEGAFMGDVSSNPIYEKSETSYVSRIYEGADD
ncbi:hypothetical protein ACTFIR_001483 [Dictyostelium discoideum]